VAVVLAARKAAGHDIVYCSGSFKIFEARSIPRRESRERRYGLAGRLRGRRPATGTSHAPRRFGFRIAMPDQPSLFALKPGLPDGFRYSADFVAEEEEAALVAEIKRLPFKEFEFHGFSGKRRVVSFGWRYDFTEAKLRRAEPIPGFLLQVRAKAARFARLEEGAFEQLLVTEYTPGAAIGWHKDRAVFNEVAGVSLLAPCTFRFRKRAGQGWQRASLRLGPRSAYLLIGPARTAWEHSIPGVDELRYSLTFRSLKR
jgi:alkylated DNA repair dioxygenase AlkB